MFACDDFGYVPDIITCAKGMTSGYSPIGAMIASDRLFEPFTHGHELRSPHGYTFGGHPVSAAVALANLDIFEREGLNEHVRDNEAAFRATLEKLLDLPIVGDVRGEGFFYGIELVKDKATKETFDDDESRAAAARLPVQGAVRRRPVLPRRRPRRPGRPAGAAADQRPGGVRRDRADPALRAHRGLEHPLSPTHRRATPRGPVAPPPGAPAARRPMGAPPAGTPDQAVARPGPRCTACSTPGWWPTSPVRRPVSRSWSPSATPATVSRCSSTDRRATDCSAALAAGQPTCLTVTLLDGMVLARSTFESSMHYRGAMVLGRAPTLAGAEKEHALEVITEHLLPGRWAEARHPSRKELAATLVLALPLTEASVKISTGPPADEPDDVHGRSGPGWCRSASRSGPPRTHRTCWPPTRSPSTSRGGADDRLPHRPARPVALVAQPARTVTARAPLPGDREADVAIVGAGYTGLWTAYYLLRADPTLRVVVLEKEIAGYGASGRNGGWCSALFPASWPRSPSESSRDEAVRLQRAMFDTVDEVGRVVAEEGIDADCAKGGTVCARPSRRPARAGPRRGRRRPRRGVRRGGLPAARRAARHVAGSVPSDVLGGVHPSLRRRSTRRGWCAGLADVVERLGATIHEHTAVTSLEPGVVRTAHGASGAPFVVRATEGYTAEPARVRPRRRARSTR